MGAPTDGLGVGLEAVFGVEKGWFGGCFGVIQGLFWGNFLLEKCLFCLSSQVRAVFFYFRAGCRRFLIELHDP